MDNKFCCSSCKSVNIVAIPNRTTGWIWKCFSCGQKEAECASCQYFGDNPKRCLRVSSGQYGKHVSERFVCPYHQGNLNPTVELVK